MAVGTIMVAVAVMLFSLFGPTFSISSPNSQPTGKHEPRKEREALQSSAAAPSERRQAVEATVPSVDTGEKASPKNVSDGLAKASRFQRTRYRLLYQLAKKQSIALPLEQDLTEQQWKDLEEVHGAFSGELAELEFKRTDRLGSITDKKLIDGGLERVVTEGQSTRDSLRAVTSASKPQFVGQQVQVRSGPSGTFVSRVSPGDDAEIDRLVDVINVTTQLYVDAAVRVLAR